MRARIAMAAARIPPAAARIATAAALLAAAFGAPAQAPIGQSIRIEATESVFARDLREDGPVNADNVLGLPEWQSSLEADIEWSIDIAHRVRIELSPSVDWLQAGGGIEAWRLDYSSAQYEDPKIDLSLAEVRLSLPEIGMEAIFGKLRPEFGANYIEPLSATKPRGREAESEAPWMGGFFLAMGDTALEAYCEIAEDPRSTICLSSLFGEHEVGILWTRRPYDSIGAFWRCQFGESMLAYAEASLREKGEFLDIPGLTARGVERNVDALAGFSFTPGDLGFSIYLEYRYRGAGYSKEDFDELTALPLPLQGAALKGLAFLQTARNSFGLHAMSETGSDDPVSWSATCFYFLPDGLDLSGTVEARIADQCRIGVEVEFVAPLSGASEAASEAAFRPDALRCDLFLKWILNAEESE